MKIAQIAPLIESVPPRCSTGGQNELSLILHGLFARRGSTVDTRRVTTGCNGEDKFYSIARSLKVRNGTT